MLILIDAFTFNGVFTKKLKIKNEASVSKNPKKIIELFLFFNIYTVTKGTVKRTMGIYFMLYLSIGSTSKAIIAKI